MQDLLFGLSFILIVANLFGMVILSAWVATIFESIEKDGIKVKHIFFIFLLPAILILLFAGATTLLIYKLKIPELMNKTLYKK